MTDELNHAASFQLVERFGAYRMQRAWGMMVIVTGISVLFFRLQMHVMLSNGIPPPENVEFFLFLVLINSIFFYGPWILPLLLTIMSYLSIKRMKIENNKISSKRYFIFTLVLFSFFVFTTLLSDLVNLIVYPILFPSLIQFEGGTAQIYGSYLPGRAVILLTRGLLFVIMYFLLIRFTKRRMNELLPPGGLFLLLFLVFTIFYHFALPLPLKFEDISWLLTYLYVICYFGSGFYSLKKASQILEGKE